MCMFLPYPLATPFPCQLYALLKEGPRARHARKDRIPNPRKNLLKRKKKRSAVGVLSKVDDGARVAHIHIGDFVGKSLVFMLQLLFGYVLLVIASPSSTFHEVEVAGITNHRLVIAKQYRRSLLPVPINAVVA